MKENLDRSIRTDRSRYTEWRDGWRALYDLVAGSAETKNVVDSNPDIAQTLSRQLQNMKQSVKATAVETGSSAFGQKTTE